MDQQPPFNPSSEAEHNPFETGGGNTGIQHPSPPPASPETSEPITFTGNGREYFGIWIVNLLLTILTLGIYSAWAKVRRLQYFYRHTQLAGASFDYHGQAQAILKGRVIGLALLIFYNVAADLSTILWWIAALLLGAVLPWLLMRSFQFRLYNTSYRGLRFSFRGTKKEAYVVFLLLPISCLFTVYLLTPLWHRELKRYQHHNAWFGQSRFSFLAPISSFYKCYVKAGGILLLGSITAGIATAMLLPSLKQALPPHSTSPSVAGSILIMGAIAGAWLCFTLLIGPYFKARLQNLVWNHTRLGEHRFESDISARKLCWISFSNMLFTILTLGLYRPFAAVRLAKYQLESVRLISTGPLDNFIAAQQTEVGATGDETAEFFDIDIAL